MASYDPGDERLVSKVIYTDALAFVVSPKHRLAKRQDGLDRRARHGDLHRAQRASRRTARSCCASSAATRCRCNMDVEMPTLETIRRLVQSNEGVAFLPAHVRAPGRRAAALCAR